MGFLAPALPWLAKGGALLGGYLGGKKAQSSAMQRSPEELQALSGAQAAGAGLAQSGTQLPQAGMPAVNQAKGYYETLLGGNRAQMGLATAAPRAAITEGYRGAERGLERSGIRGAAGDVARAELNRDRVGKIAGLTSGVQPMAAEALANLGLSMTEQGAQRQGGAASLYQRLLGEGAANREYGRKEGEKSGTRIGRFLLDILGAGVGGGGKKGIPGLPGGSSGPF